ncbi:peptidoglycan DD-metalloendopeptidase family protein [Parendozoicomonas sp. Alg238-R29]|uniref:OapA family protein n=1 Tax=Parendozoicomonas sp. Alg238-R29 TaxID=2993446 RepID=UPI00248F2720|nr:peptidoglycan DD-metalloendopeptidase family protein [Parendozoicomonas sp. Alg238-R29]
MNLLKQALQFAAKNFPRRHVLVIAAASSCVGLMLALVPGENAQAKRTEIPLSLTDIDNPTPVSALPSEEKTLLNQAPDTPERSTSGITTKTPESIKPTAPVQPVIAWQQTKVRSGDTLSGIFSRQSLSAGTLQRILRTSDHGKVLADIRPGQTIVFGRINGELQALKYLRNRLESIEYRKTENGFESQEIIRTPDIRRAYASGTIVNSLFVAATNAGLTDNMTMKLANIFGWDIDFVMDIRNGDSFNLVYEEKYLDGERIGDGNILAATFTNRGKKLEAVYFTDSKGESDYYSADGKSMRKSFIRTPVDFTRISSRFNPNRLHPVFKTKRPHRGVDYAAPTGTPIKASGDGVVKFSGRQNGFGNVVFIKHPNNIVTVYAHQSRIARGLRKGQRVKQGQTIGYVGQTGWATGPHLHYEFRVNGVHRNPLTIKLPDAQPLVASEINDFRSLTRVMLAELEQKSATLLASAEDNGNVSTQ